MTRLLLTVREASGFFGIGRTKFEEILGRPLSRLGQTDPNKFLFDYSSALPPGLDFEKPIDAGGLIFERTEDSGGTFAQPVPSHLAELLLKHLPRTGAVKSNSDDDAAMISTARGTLIAVPATGDLRALTFRRNMEILVRGFCFRPSVVESIVRDTRSAEGFEGELPATIAELKKGGLLEPGCLSRPLEIERAERIKREKAQKAAHDRLAAEVAKLHPHDLEKEGFVIVTIDRGVEPKSELVQFAFNFPRSEFAFVRDGARHFVLRYPSILPRPEADAIKIEPGVTLHVRGQFEARKSEMAHVTHLPAQLMDFALARVAPDESGTVAMYDLKSAAGKERKEMALAWIGAALPYLRSSKGVLGNHDHAKYVLAQLKRLPRTLGLHPWIISDLLTDAILDDGDKAGLQARDVASLFANEAA